MPELIELTPEMKAVRDGALPLEPGLPVPTWIYDTDGGSQLIDLSPGASPPKGWAFAPPSGVEMKSEAQASPVYSPPMPFADPRLVDMEQRVAKLEAQMAEVGEYLEAISSESEQTDPPADTERDDLVSRAAALGITVHHRAGVEKIRAAIAEAEATQKPAE